MGPKGDSFLYSVNYDSIHTVSNRQIWTPVKSEKLMYEQNHLLSFDNTSL